MTKQAIILTASKGFGELIRQVLNDASALEPVLVSSPAKVLELAAKKPLDLLVIDTDFDSLNFAAYLAEVRAVTPDCHVVIIPAENKPDDPSLEKLGADVILSKPFYLPDLVAAIEKLYGPLDHIEVPSQASYGAAPARLKVASPPTAHPAPDWLRDVSLSAQYLTQLSLESASQAALITRGDKVWAYAGELPQSAAEELARAVSHDVDGSDSDVARFVHLNATKADYMLYATPLGDEYKLSLVFDAQMPFSKMRSQVDKLANALAAAPQTEAVEQEVLQARKVVAARLEQSGQPPIPRRRFGSIERGEGSAPEPTGQGSVAGIGRVASQTGRLEPLSPGSYDLHYSYVLIPRLPGHRLEGDLADKLAHWLPQLCLAFAWRLENISVQPQFVQWMVSMSPDASPESVVHTLEKHLSERIFEEFPKLKRENPSGEFFAPGFLIINGSLPSSELVRDYIQQTRTRQGVPNQA